MPVCGPPGGEPCRQLPRLPARRPLPCRLHLGLMVPFLRAACTLALRSVAVPQSWAAGWAPACRAGWRPWLGGGRGGEAPHCARSS